MSVDFLKALLDLARDVVQKERGTPVMVRRIIDDIDEIVRQIRFDGWQATHAGEREVRMALRRTLFKYKLHHAELFERAYGYIKEHY